MRDSYHLD